MTQRSRSTFIAYFVRLMLLSTSQVSICLASASANNLTSDAPEFAGEVVIEGVSYHMLVGDLHMHTTYSDGAGTPLQMVEASRKHYDFIAITDHGTIQGAIDAKAEVEKYGIHLIVIIGEEVTTGWGHLLALDINQVVPQNLEPAETFKRIHAQGGYAIPAHPLSFWQESVFTFLIENYYIDAYEAYSGGSNCTYDALDATPVVAQYPFVGNSDAHDHLSGKLGYPKTIVFSVNRTVNGIFDAILNQRVVIKLGPLCVGNATLVNLVQNSSNIFEAKAAIGSAEVSIVRAERAVSVNESAVELAEELCDTALDYYWARNYDAAIDAAQQTEEILSADAPANDAPTVLVLIVITAVIVTVAVTVYRKKLGLSGKTNLAGGL